ncbi:MAG: dTDP-glucose 4,6-dehydratase [bacterium]
MNYLVTGGAGFIGTNFIRLLLAREPQVSVVNLDALTYAGSLENLRDLPDSARYEFVRGDICDQELVSRLFRHHSVDTVVHFAAETHVDRSIVAPDQFVKTNVFGTFVLLETARRFWLEERALPRETVRFHHISTDEVFGDLGPADPAFNELAPYAPNSPYSASKAASDHLVRAYGRTYGLPFTLTNCSNNYGPYQFPEKLIPLMLANARNRLPLPVYGDGGQVRDWLHVEDHCEAILAVLKRGRIGETYVVGGDNQPTNLELVRTLCAVLDELQPDPACPMRESLVEFVADRPGHDRRYAMNIAKIRSELGWQPSLSLAEGLRRTVQWYLDNEAWLAAISSRPEHREWLKRNYDHREKR